MNYFNEKIEAVVALLKAASSLKNCVIQAAYEASRKPTVLKQPWIAVSLRSAGAQPIAVGDNARQISTQVGVALYLPQQSGTNAASTLINSVADCLFFSCNEPAVKWDAGPLKWDSDTDALVIQCSFWLEEVL